jgi:hypothetical protein
MPTAIAIIAGSRRLISAGIVAQSASDHAKQKRLVFCAKIFRYTPFPAPIGLSKYSCNLRE